ncbi:16S rRNA (guanine(527)-N(7))-methyltransferase RsmG [Mycoplasma sp. 5370]
MNFYKEKTRIFVNNEDNFKTLEKYVNLIEEKNKVMNLTGFSGDVLWKEGIYESLLFMEESFANKITTEKNHFLDVGAGAGFPSVPFLITKPNIKLTIYEPLKKRVNFLNIVKEELDLNMEIFPLRAEESKEKEVFDFVCARAVMDFKRLFEITHHLGKKGAFFSFLKGPKAQEEVQSSVNLTQKFNEEINVNELKIFEDKQNFTINFHKLHSTPIGFPRKWDKILKEK